MLDRFQHSLRKYFGISRMEANGILVLIIMMMILLFSPVVYNQYIKGDYNSYLIDSLKLDSLVRMMEARIEAVHDTMKLDQRKERPVSPRRNNKIVENSYDEMKKRIKVDINKADSSDLISIYGIGKVLSGRIIKYRELLGGYFNIEQLNDVYGLKGKALENIKSAVYVDTLFVPKRIKVNFSEWEELVRHPYIDSRLANDIIHLRSMRGFLKRIEDLEEISYLDDHKLSRLSPYLEF